MIDTHLHILPGVDDGPETIQESLALAQVLVQEGIHTAIVTPHYNDEFPQHSAAEIREQKPPRKPAPPSSRSPGRPHT